MKSLTIAQELALLELEAIQARKEGRARALKQVNDYNNCHKPAIELRQKQVIQELKARKEDSDRKLAERNKRYLDAFKDYNNSGYCSYSARRDEMEEMIIALESQPTPSAEELERQFADLEAHSSVDVELEAMKRQLLGIQ